MRYAAILLMLTAASQLAGQSKDAVPEISFGVDYRGGDSDLKPVKYGRLVLTDTTIVFLEQHNDGKKPPLFVIPIKGITSVGSAMDHRVAGTGQKLLIGSLASGTNDETVTIAFDGATDAQAPLFNIDAGRSAEFVAKVKFRMKKLGVAVKD